MLPLEGITVVALEQAVVTALAPERAKAELRRLNGQFTRFRERISGRGSARFVSSLHRTRVRFASSGSESTPRFCHGEKRRFSSTAAPSHGSETRQRPGDRPHL